MPRLKNLLVSGCSYTFNQGWAEHIKNKHKLKLINLACSGAGNTHIANSIITHCELNKFKVGPSNTYVIIMWSGPDRLDTMIDTKHTNTDTTRDQFEYSPHSAWLGTGGARGMGNNPAVADVVLRPAYPYKDAHTQALECYMTVCTTWHYLRNRGFKFKFLNYRNLSITARDDAFDWMALLPEHLEVDSMFMNCTTPYEYALKHDGLSDDDYHPTEQSFVQWCDKNLLPEIEHEIIN